MNNYNNHNLQKGFLEIKICNYFLINLLVNFLRTEVHLFLTNMLSIKATKVMWGKGQIPVNEPNLMATQIDPTQKAIIYRFSLV